MRCAEAASSPSLFCSTAAPSAPTRRSPTGSTSIPPCSRKAATGCAWRPSTTWVGERSTKPSDLTVEPSGSEIVDGVARRVLRARPESAGARRRHRPARTRPLRRERAPARERRPPGRLGPGDGARAQRPEPATGRSLVAKGKNIRVSDLALDGGGPAGGRGRRDRVAVFDGSSDVRLQRLRITPRPDRRRQRLGRALERLRSGLADRERRERRGRRRRARLGRVAGHERDPHRGSAASASFGILLAAGARPSRRGRSTGSRSTTSSATSAIRRRDACCDGGAVQHAGLRDERGRHLDRRRRGRGDREHGPARAGGTGSRPWARRRAPRSCGTRSPTRGPASTSSTRRTGRLFARNLIVDALVGINVEWWHEGAGSSRNTFAFNRIVRVEGRTLRRRRRRPATASSGTRSSAACDRRSSSRARRTTSCGTISAAGAGATRSSSSPRPGTTTGGGPCRSSTNSTATRTRPRRAEGPRAGPGGGRLGSPVLVEDRGERGLLRRGADPGSGARAHRPGHDRLHHGDRARGRAPGGAGDHRRRPPFSSPAGSRRAARCSSTQSRSCSGAPCSWGPLRAAR